VRIDQISAQLRPVDSKVDTVNGRSGAGIKVDTKLATVDFADTRVIAARDVNVVKPIALQTEAREGVVVVI